MTENLRLVIEYNTYGSDVIKHLLTLYPTRNDFDEGIIVKYKHRVSAKRTQLGLKLNSDNKKILCQSLKESVRKNRLVLTHPKTIEEATTFSRTKNGSYAAQSGHDDAIMTCVNVCSVFDTPDYTEIVEEYFDFIDPQLRSEINEILEQNDADGDSFNIYEIL